MGEKNEKKEQEKQDTQGNNLHCNLRSFNLWMLFGFKELHSDDNSWNMLVVYKFDRLGKYGLGGSHE